MGMKISEASATYANADRSQRITINLTDMPAMGGMMAMAGAFGGESESQSADGYEKTYVRDGQRIQEKWNNRTKRGEYGIRSEEHTYELQSLMRTSYAVFCLKK